MGKHRKKAKKTHLKGGALSHAPGVERAPESKVPRSFVIRSGDVGKSVAQLVREVRTILEPNTATRLRERSSNRLPDFLALTSALQLTHILIFTRTDKHVNLRVARTPRGPTLHLRVERYSLASDLRVASRHFPSIGKAGEVPPLLVMNGFPTASRPHKLLTTLFQSLFPPLDISTLPLSAARRLLLLSYNPSTHTIDLRHYSITVKPYGVSKRVRRIVPSSTQSRKTAAVPDLSSVQDVADFVLGQAGGGYETGSESEAESEAEEGPGGKVVQLAEDYVGRGNRKDEKRAVKLREIGPRMELRLVKITTGLAGSEPKKGGGGGGGEGEVLFHEFVKKTPKEAKETAAAHARKKAEQAARRKEQEANVARKQAEKAARKGAAPSAEDDAEEKEDEEEQAEWGEDEEWSAEGEEAGEDEEEEEDLDEMDFGEVSEGEEGEDEGSKEEDEEEDDVPPAPVPAKRARVEAPSSKGEGKAATSGKVGKARKGR